MILFVFGLFVGCGLGIFLISLLAKSKEADEAWRELIPRLPAGVEAGNDFSTFERVQNQESSAMVSSRRE